MPSEKYVYPSKPQRQAMRKFCKKHGFRDNTDLQNAAMRAFFEQYGEEWPKRGYGVWGDLDA